MRGMDGHEFWTDSLSLIDCEFVDPALLSSHSRVTDSYLLALARANKGRLATMDTKLAAEVVAQGRKFLELILQLPRRQPHGARSCSHSGFSSAYTSWSRHWPSMKR